MRTVKIFVGSGIQIRSGGCKIGFRACFSSVGWSSSRVGIVGQECPTHTSRAWAICEFQRGLEVDAEARGFFGGRMHPLVEGVADVATLGLVFYDYEAEEAASGSQTRAHGIGAGEHAIEGEGHVVVFGELEDG